MATGMIRKRSNSKLQDEQRHVGVRYSAVSASAPQQRLRGWQALALLAAAAAALLLLVLALARGGGAGGGGGGGGMPKCFPMSDRDRVMQLGPQNRVVNHTVATSSPWAQALFNLGLLALHGFNQGEAKGMFQACLRADPSCAMCYWGLAYAEGPMPNKVAASSPAPYPVFLPAHARAAAAFAQRAAELNGQAATRAAAAGAAGAAAAEAARRDGLYTRALAARFAGGAEALLAGRWEAAEAAYAAEMARVAEEEQDADAAALAAEAHMNLSPWDYYQADGSLRPSAAAAEALLLRALELNPRHTHALHLHVHVAEAGAPSSPPPSSSPSSPSPPPPPAAAARGLGSADALAALGAGAQNGHLMHMPSHLYVRMGLYRRAVEVNRAAYDHDVARGQQCAVPYLPEHNVHVMVFAASMAGMFHTAQGFARGMRSLRDRVPDTWMAKGREWVSLPTLQMRYGEWADLLAAEAPPDDARGVTALGGREYALVVHRAGRLLALAARAASAAQLLLGVEDVTAFDLARKSLERREKEVAREHRLLKAAVAAVPQEPPTKPGAPPGMYSSGYAQLARVAEALAAARVELLRNSTEAAAERLREAAVLEDSLGYMEPPRVHQPVRQCLGWVHLHAGQYDQAWRAYSEDLERHPDNGWSLLGLKQVAEARGQGAEGVAPRLDRAWAGAEVSIDSSCPALSRPFGTSR